jgi:hypothetical protein
VWLDEVRSLLSMHPAERVSWASGARRRAALVPLFVAAEQLWLPLVRRSVVPRHEGPLSFPGPRRELGRGDPQEAARAGAEADIRLHAGHVVVLGELNDVVTPAGTAIAPIVGAVPPPSDAAARGKGWTPSYAYPSPI